MTNRSYRIRAGNRVLDVTMMTWPRDDRPVPERSGELNASRTPSAARNASRIDPPQVLRGS
jgi:hypothetical protein